MTGILNETEIKLVTQYKRIEKGRRPEWAFQISPSIPFIGNALKSPRILAYSSAENLTYLNTPRKGQHLSLSSSEHENYYRHRFLFLNYLQDYDKFPNIHIQPIKDGSLLTVIRYIVDKVYKNSFSINPFDFIEEISVGNFCKYSIRSIKNIDYAQNYKRLSESIEFIISDLRLIKPDLIILPKTIFNTIDKKYSYNWDYIIKQSELKKPLRIVRIYQTNSQVINTHISKDPKSHLDSTSVESFCSKWPIRKSIKGLKLYLNWLDQNWDDLTLVKQ